MTTRQSTTISVPFAYSPSAWKPSRQLHQNVELMRSKDGSSVFIVKKTVRTDSVVTTSNGRDTPESDHVSLPWEVCILQALVSSNRLVKALAFAPVDPTPTYGSILFEFYPLGDIFEWHEKQFLKKNRKPVPESYIWRMFIQMAQALAFLQKITGPDRLDRSRLAILHRDIKPQNVLVVDNGSTYPSFKLTDFGCARFWERARDAERSSFCGTYEWQPPENPLINTPAAETWALGALVHFLATCGPPIDMDDSMRMYTAANGRLPTAAGDYNPPGRYYAARCARKVLPINIGKAEQRELGIGPRTGQSVLPEYNPVYSDELNVWMMRCLHRTASRRPSTKRLVETMAAEGYDILRAIGGKNGLVDMDITFGV